MAIVMVGHTHAACASSLNDAPYSVVSINHDAGDSQDSSIPTAHHCCCTHVANDPATGANALPHLIGVKASTPLSDGQILSGLQEGPERPPRASAS
jgi:hypothetical protein